jgi:hypothetical protein
MLSRRHRVATERARRPACPYDDRARPKLRLHLGIGSHGTQMDLRTFVGPG